MRPLRQKLDSLDNQEERIAELEKALHSLTKQLNRAAEALSAARRAVCDQIVESIDGTSEGFTYGENAVCR